MIFKILGIIDIIAGILLIILVNTNFKYLLVAPLILKGLFSLFN